MSDDQLNRPWTAEAISSEDVGKKEIVQFLQENASSQFLHEHKLKGQSKNVAKTSKKDALINYYNQMFETKAFKGKADDVYNAANAAATAEMISDKAAALKLEHAAKDGSQEVPRFTKRILKKGDKVNFCKKGDIARVWYTGKLESGTVFDTNILTGKKKKSAMPLSFKVGAGKVIRGWDEALQTMAVGEKAEVTIEPIWAYGKKGLEGKIPPNSTLVFEVELVGVE
uniref:peptidylprolyl isomerase n=1 Tax=Saccoglossus kowalevskii TaxID=10224 RepID=A0ABM0H0D4_SACKO|nr:PREDICTED: peptidyl-prolyl cis-trans isomerase FKBP3-like [Saccoglossus kowalevskii]